MTKVDRRIRKSQEAIKAAVIELMSEKISMISLYRIFPIGQTLAEAPFICIT